MGHCTKQANFFHLCALKEDILFSPFRSGGRDEVVYEQMRLDLVATQPPHTVVPRNKMRQIGSFYRLLSVSNM